MVDRHRLLEPIARIAGQTVPRLRGWRKRLEPKLLQPRHLPHPLLPALAAAVLSQGLLVALVRPLLPPGSDRARSTPVDDTPELLRLGDRLNPLTGGGPSLGQPLTLPLPPPPPPPPDLLGSPAAQPAATRMAPGTTGSSPVPTRVRSTAPSAPPAPVRSTDTAKGSPSRGSTTIRAKPAEATAAPATEAQSPAAAGLPRQPGAALELARAIAEGAASALPNDGVTQAMAAQQRRQLWLDPGQQRQLQRTWEQADVSAPPADWGDLPDGTQVRRTSRVSLGSLADGDVRARSLVSRLHITLLWPQGSQLWLLRLPLAGPASQTNPG